MAVPSFKSAPGSDPGGGARSATAGRRHPIFTAWWLATVLLAAAIAYLWVWQPPRPDPFANPRPLLSVEWWLNPLPHRAMTAASEVPVGARSAFIPREAPERATAVAQQLGGTVHDAAIAGSGRLAVLVAPIDPGGRFRTVELDGDKSDVQDITEAFAGGCTRVVVIPPAFHNAGIGCPGASTQVGFA